MFRPDPTILSISPQSVREAVIQKAENGCTVKWRRRNSVVVDCDGELEGFETDPAYPYDTGELGGRNPIRFKRNESLVTIRRTDEDGGLKGAIKRSISDLGGLRKYIKPTDNVAMKVNIASGLTGNPSTYTNPDAVEIMADEISRVCEDRTRPDGSVDRVCAKPFFVEADNVWMDFVKVGDRVMESFGFMDLIDRANRKGKPNIPFLHLTTGNLWDGGKKIPWKEWAPEGTGRVKYHFLHPHGFVTDLGQLLVDPQTKVISVSKPKQHMFCGISVDSKNMYGSYPDGDKSKYHQLDIEGVIAASVRVQRPVLTLSDWTTVCAGWLGPAVCEPFVDNKVIMSNDFLCVSEDTVIFVKGDEEYFAIPIYRLQNLIKKNALIQVYTPKGFVPVKSIASRDSDAHIYEIQTMDNHLIRISATHKVPVYSDGSVTLKDCKDLVIGDRLRILPFIPELHNSIDSVDLKNVFVDGTYLDEYRNPIKTVGDKIQLNRQLKIEKDFPLSNNLLTMIGLTVSEGTLSKRKDGGSVSIYNNHLDIGDFIIDFCNRENIGCTVTASTHERGGGFHIGSKFYIIAKYIVGIGGQKAPEKEIPDIIFKMESHLRKSFLRGLFSGDGGFPNNYITYATSSYKLIQQLYYLLLLEGFNPHLYRRENKPREIDGRRLGKTTMYDIKLMGYIDLWHFSREIGFIQKSRNALLKDYIQSKNSRGKTIWKIISACKLHTPLSSYEIAKTINENPRKVYDGLERLVKAKLIESVGGVPKRYIFTKKITPFDLNQVVFKRKSVEPKPRFSKIKTIRVIEGYGKLYDISLVSEDHTFYAGNGIEIHNCGDNIGRELAGIDEGTVPHLEINKNMKEGIPWCKFAEGSVPLDDAKNPELIAKAPPKWWFDGGRDLTQLLFSFPPWLMRKAGVDLIYPTMEGIDKLITDIYSPQLNQSHSH